METRNHRNKVTDQSPSSGANARHLREISPGVYPELCRRSRNGNGRLCASHSDLACGSANSVLLKCFRSSRKFSNARSALDKNTFTS